MSPTTVRPEIGEFGLLVARPTADSHTRGSRIGGLPTGSAGFEWPTCATHGVPMHFVAQFDLGDRLIEVFYCEYEPGLCDAWEPDAGSNAALVIHTGQEIATIPAPQGIVPAPASPMSVEMIACDDDDDAVAAAQQLATDAGLAPIGLWGGEPRWIQGDETPAGTRYAALLDNTPLDFNFADGLAYVFISDDGSWARTLFQC